MPGRTYLDTGVLLAAYKGDEAASDRAMAIIADEERSFIASDLLTIECVCPAIRSRHFAQAAFCSEFINSCDHIELNRDISQSAIQFLSNHAIQIIDAMHICAAVHAGAEEFITTEAVTKPFFQLAVPLSVISIS